MVGRLVLQVVPVGMRQRGGGPPSDPGIGRPSGAAGAIPPECHSCAFVGGSRCAPEEEEEQHAGEHLELEVEGKAEPRLGD